MQEKIQQIPFIDLKAQYRLIATKVHEGIERVCEGGQFVMGQEVMELEEKLALFANVRHCVSCSNGTDALLLPLMSWGIGSSGDVAGDKTAGRDCVFVPGYTFVATAGAVAHLGAIPFFVDVDENFLMSPASLEQGIKEAREKGLRPKAVIPVDLFGMPCDYEALLSVAGDLKILADSAQSFGARRGDKKVGQMGDVTTTSFYPAKPLGCYGEGGAIFCDDEETARHLRLRRSHGEEKRYESTVVGLNARLDTIQAVVLLEKLKLFADELFRRNQIARRYNEGFLSHLGGEVICPDLGDEDKTSSWAQYTLRLQGRDKVQHYCKERGVPTVVYYPIPLSQQLAYKQYPQVGDRLLQSEKLATEALSLPMSPYMSNEQVDYVISVVTDGVKQSK